MIGVLSMICVLRVFVVPCVLVVLHRRSGLRMVRVRIVLHGLGRLRRVRVLCVFVVLRMAFVLGARIGGGESRREQHRQQQRVLSADGAHSDTATSRIIPASMW